MTATLPWLEYGFDFLVGLSPDKIPSRQLLIMRVFVDDSGCKGQPGDFVFAGLMSDVESWVNFARDWKIVLNQEPKIKVFKMSEVAGGGDRRQLVDIEVRNNKLRALASVINQHVRRAIYVGIDVKSFSESVGRILPKPYDQPYYMAYQKMIIRATKDLWHQGMRDQRFEIIFDVQTKMGPISKANYPVLCEGLRKRHPDWVSIMPVEPKFETDDEFLPLQAADMFAYCVRKPSLPEYEDFDWLLNEMKAVKHSEHSIHLSFDYEEIVIDGSITTLADLIDPDDLKSAEDDLYS